MLTVNLIIPDLSATSKKHGLQVIAQQTAPLFHADADALLGALMDRERIGSTGIGGGVAIPHIKVDKIQRMYSVLTRLAAPVDYDALDGLPVDLIFMLVAPVENKTTQHLKTLAFMSRFLKDANNCALLRACTTREEIQSVLNAWSQGQAA